MHNHKAASERIGTKSADLHAESWHRQKQETSEETVEGLAWLRELVEVSADVTTTAVHGVSPSVTSCTSQVPNQRVGLALRGREDQGTPAFEVRGDTKNSLQDPPLVAFLPQLPNSLPNSLCQGPGIVLDRCAQPGSA